MTEVEHPAKYCPTCNSNQLVRVRRKKSERYRLQAKYICQNCGQRLFLRHKAYRVLNQILNADKSSGDLVVEKK